MREKEKDRLIERYRETIRRLTEERDDLRREVERLHRVTVVRADPPPPLDPPPPPLQVRDINRA